MVPFMQNQQQDDVLIVNFAYSCDSELGLCLFISMPSGSNSTSWFTYPPRTLSEIGVAFSLRTSSGQVKNRNNLWQTVCFCTVS